MLAPVVGAENSRNALWKLKRNQSENYNRRFEGLPFVEGPWSNNENWKELAGRE